MEDHLFQGAESRIYVGNFLQRKMLIKKRFKKVYRVPDLDTHLSRERMKAECRNNIRCKQAGIRTPAIYFIDNDRSLIYMEYFEKAVTVKAFIQDVENRLTNEKDSNKDELEQKFLQVSNLIDDNNQIIDLVLIDFGLSQSDGSNEDKAVDLYVLERAISSTHSSADKLVSNILRIYSKTLGEKSADVLKKFGEVRSRGRKRTMVG